MLSGMTDEAAVQVDHEDVPPVPSVVPGRSRLGLVIAGLAGVVVGAGAVGLAWGLSGPSAPAVASASASGSPSSSGPSSTFTLFGSLTLAGAGLSSINDPDAACSGHGGYSDITEGASVTVYDSSGKILAVGSLGAGARSEVACRFPIAVSGVPRDSSFYQVEVTHRGKVTLAKADAQAGTFAATLG